MVYVLGHDETLPKIWARSPKNYGRQTKKFNFDDFGVICEVAFFLTFHE